MSGAADRRIGQVLSGKWRLDAVLGAGGMATVFAGTHVRNGSKVAVKVLHQELSRKAEVRRRFVNEGYVANRVDHPGIVRILDDDAHDEHVYLVMELLRGKSLKDLFDAGPKPMSSDDVVRYLSSALETLSVAHKAGVVHRDLKPDNIFVTDAGAVKLLDFGIARIREEQAIAEQATATGTMLGTPAFMPPEQAMGKWDQVDGRTDLYAVGATAWFLLTGKLVHDASSITELLVAVATKKAPSIRTVRSDLPAGIVAAIDRALAFDQADRWPDAMAMARAMREVAPQTEVVPPVASDAKSTPRMEGQLDRSATVEVATVQTPLPPMVARSPERLVGPTMQSTPAPTHPTNPVIAVGDARLASAAEVRVQEIAPTVRLDADVVLASGVLTQGWPTPPAASHPQPPTHATPAPGTWSAAAAAPSGYDPRALSTTAATASDKPLVPSTPPRSGRLALLLVPAAGIVAATALVLWLVLPGKTQGSTPTSATPAVSAAPAAPTSAPPATPTAEPVAVPPGEPSAPTARPSAAPQTAPEVPSAKPAPSPPAPAPAPAPAPKTCKKTEQKCSGMDLHGNRDCKTVCVKY